MRYKSADDWARPELLKFCKMYQYSQQPFLIAHHKVTTLLRNTSFNYINTLS